MTEFLSPVSKTLQEFAATLPEHTLGKNILRFTTTSGLPDLENVQLVLLGIAEARRHHDYKDITPQFDDIRKSFYQLYPGNWHLSIADLGDILPGETVEDTYAAAKAVLGELLRNNIIPIIIGGSQDLTYAVYRAYDDVKKMVNLVNVDAQFDIGNADAPINNRSYVGKMVMEQPYNLFNYTAVGYQSYFNSIEEIELLEKMYFDAYRLGEVAKNISSVEPVMRDADIVSFDLKAIKSADLCYSTISSPNGFDGREVCAISRYAGLSNKVSCFGLFGIIDNQVKTPTAMLLAQMIWYFAEGVNYRVNDGDFTKESDFVTYRVPIDDEVLVFKKSLLTERWWIELPFISDVNNKLKRHTLLPCTHNDYEMACRQEIPERWYKARKKNEI